jgi:hypothetical protein
VQDAVTWPAWQAGVLRQRNRSLSPWAFAPRPVYAQNPAAVIKSAPSSSPEKLQLLCFQLQTSTVSGHGKQRRMEFQGLTRNAAKP